MKRTDKMMNLDRVCKKPYRPSYITSLAREFRKNATLAEKKLWLALRRKKFFGYRFRRQATFGRFIFDFYCPQKKLAIEIDGDSHENKKEFDKNREGIINAAGIVVLRFSNKQVFDGISDVLCCIETALIAKSTFPPS